MLRVDGNDPVKGRCNAIHAEQLVVGGIIRLGLYDAFWGQFCEQCAVCGVLEYALKSTVPFLGDFTRSAVSKDANTKVCEVGGVRSVENRNHSVHHLGVILTEVTPPEKTI